MSNFLLLQVGTYQIAIVTKAANKPFYVVAESFKFVRLYPLNQQDVPNKHKVILSNALPKLQVLDCLLCKFVFIFVPFLLRRTPFSGLPPFSLFAWDTCISRETHSFEVFHKLLHIATPFSHIFIKNYGKIEWVQMYFSVHTHEVISTVLHVASKPWRDVLHLRLLLRAAKSATYEYR